MLVQFSFSSSPGVAIAITCSNHYFRILADGADTAAAGNAAAGTAAAGTAAVDMESIAEFECIVDVGRAGMAEKVQRGQNYRIPKSMWKLNP